jgi:hypothetical protein
MLFNLSCYPRITDMILYAYFYPGIAVKYINRIRYENGSIIGITFINASKRSI